MAGPETPGTAFVLGHHTLGDIGGKKGAWGWPRGGMGAISDSIARSARHHGAMIRTGAEVRRVLVREGRAVGVELADGNRIESSVVRSNADPKRTFLRLVEKEHLPPEFIPASDRIRVAPSRLKPS